MPDKESALRILVVEDDYLVAALLGEMLTDLGHSVVGPFARLAPALDAAQKESVDLAILDVNLTEGDTSPVAGALRKRGIPLVVSSGYDSESLGASFAGAARLQKPFQQDDLQKVIASLRPMAAGPSKIS